jgi:hypothetical protein
MESLVFLKKDGKENIRDESGAEAMDAIENPDSYVLKQLFNLDSHLEESVKTPTNETTVKLSAERSIKYMA